MQWVDFRTEPDEWVPKAEPEGGLASLNHPVLGPLSWHKPLSRPPALMELWHSSWDRQDEPALQCWASFDRPVPVGGSDFHRPGDIDATGAPLWPGAPTTWVEVTADGPGPPEVGSIMAALRAGSVAVSASPAGPTVVRLDGELVVSGAEGATLAMLDAPGQPLAPARQLKVTSDLAALKAGPGPALLVADGRALALCPW